MSYFGGRRIYIDSDGNEYYDYERDYEPKPITNADRIRAMTDEELAEFIWKVELQYWKPMMENDILDWLKKESTNEST